MALQSVEILSVGRLAEASEHVVLLKEEQGKRILPLVIGPFEAAAIALGIEAAIPPRPLTHDLLRNVLDRLHGELRRVAIHDVRDDTFICQLDIGTQHGIMEIDCRPSDGIALAVRMGAPIVVAEEVLATSGVMPEDG